MRYLDPDPLRAAARVGAVDRHASVVEGARRREVYGAREAFAKAHEAEVAARAMMQRRVNDLKRRPLVGPAAERHLERMGARLMEAVSAREKADALKVKLRHELESRVTAFGAASARKSYTAERVSRFERDMRAARESIREESTPLLPAAVLPEIGPRSAPSPRARVPSTDAPFSASLERIGALTEASSRNEVLAGAEVRGPLAAGPAGDAAPHAEVAAASAPVHVTHPEMTVGVLGPDMWRASIRTVDAHTKEFELTKEGRTVRVEELSGGAVAPGGAKPRAMRAESDDDERA